MALWAKKNSTPSRADQSKYPCFQKPWSCWNLFFVTKFHIFSQTYQWSHDFNIFYNCNDFLKEKTSKTIWCKFRITILIPSIWMWSKVHSPWFLLYVSSKQDLRNITHRRGPLEYNTQMLGAKLKYKSPCASSDCYIPRTHWTNTKWRTSIIIVYLRHIFMLDIGFKPKCPQTFRG